MRFPRPPFNFSGQDAFPRHHAPLLVDHTGEIPTDLSVDAGVIERLEQREAANRELLDSLLSEAAESKR